MALLGSLGSADSALRHDCAFMMERQSSVDKTTSWIGELSAKANAEAGTRGPLPLTPHSEPLIILESYAVNTSRTRIDVYHSSM